MAEVMEIDDEENTSKVQIEKSHIPWYIRIFIFFIKRLSINN